jgi:MFS family permease
VLVLDKGMDWGWFSLNSLLCYFSVAAFTYIFTVIEKNSAEPIIDLKFFRNSIFLNTLANNFIIFMGMMGSIFLLPIFAQTYLGYNATQTGFLFMPMALVMVLSAPIGGAMTGRIKTKYILTASTMIAAVGIYWFSFLDPKSTALDIILPLSVMAFGMGFGMAQRTNLVAVAVPAEEIGIASSILALVRNISGAFGIAVFATILNSSINSNVLKIGQLSSLSIQAPDKIQQFVSLIILKAQVDAYGRVFMISAIVVFVGALTALFLKIPNEEKMKEKVMVE